MIKALKTQLKSGQNPIYTITKKTQTRGHDMPHGFIFLASRHHASPYGINPDTTKHMNKGDRFKVISFIPEDTPGHSFVNAFKCVDMNGKIFHIFQNDFSRFAGK